jgi:uncharacterized secreted protein with C-terminal beta-propeller domain
MKHAKQVCPHLDCEKLNNHFSAYDMANSAQEVEAIVLATFEQERYNAELKKRRKWHKASNNEFKYMEWDQNHILKHA